MASYYNEHTVLWLNGEFVKASEAKMDYYSQSFHYGYSVFEGIRSYKTASGDTKIFKAEAQGPLLNANMKAFLDRAKPKDIIFIDEIKVVGPDKQPRKLGQIAFTII